jgi:WD40 repeat protein
MIQVWDAEVGKVISGPFTGHTGSVNSVAFSPDGERVASGSTDKTIHVWDVKTGKVTSRLSKGDMEAVCSVAFSPDSKRTVSGSTDQTIRVWDVETGQVVSQPLRGHTSLISSVAFSPDGKHIVTGSQDNQGMGCRHQLNLFVHGLGYGVNCEGSSRSFLLHVVASTKHALLWTG